LICPSRLFHPNQISTAVMFRQENIVASSTGQVCVNKV